MNNKMQTRPCAACQQPGNGVVSEVFADNSSAFRRHAQLVQVGHAPSFCMKRDGTCYVCHFDKAG